MRKIILEDTFDFKQKAIFIILFSIPILFLIGLVNNADNLFGNKKLILITLILCFSLLLILFFLSIIFSKKGFLIRNNSLFLSYTFLGRNIYSKSLSLNEKTAFTFFKQNIIQKNTYLSAGGADLSYKDISFTLVLLDKNHTKKKQIITLNSIKNIDKLKLFFESFTNLKHEVYSPNFSD